MNLETWIVVWLQIGLICLALSAFCRLRVHAALRQVAARTALVMIPLVILLNTGSWRKAAALPTPPIWYATPVASYVESKAPTGALVRTAPAENRLPELSFAQILTLGWALIALFLLVRVGLGFRAYMALKKRTRECEESRVRTIAKELGLAASQVRSGDVSEPFLAGFLRPTIYLPDSLIRTASDIELKSVMVHEATHVRNGDLKWRLFGELAKVLLWPQPMIRMVLKALAQSDEERCDQQVLASGVPSATYADILVTLAAGGRTHLRIAGAVGFSSGLGRRIRLVLAKRLPAPRDLSPKGKLALIALQTAGLAAAFLLVGGAGVKPAPQDNFLPLERPLTVSITDVDGSPMQSGYVYAQGFSRSGRDPAMELKVADGKVRIDPAKFNMPTSVMLLAKSEKSAYTVRGVWNGQKETTNLRLDSKATVSGRFLLPDGKPAANTRMVCDFLVRKVDDGQIFEYIKLPPSLGEFAKTDADGRFSTNLFAIDTTFRVDCPDLRETANVNRRIEVKTAVMNLGDIRLDVGATFEGRVTRDGKPVAGIEVGSQSLMEGGFATTDANGNYRLTRQPADTYNIALKLSEEQEQEVTARAHEQVKIKAGETISGMDFQLIPGAIIRGKVVQNGKGKAGVMVGIYGPAHPQSGAWVQGITTDKNGEFMTRVPGGDQYVYIMEDLSDRVDALGTSARVTAKDGEEKRVDLQYPG